MRSNALFTRLMQPLLTSVLLLSLADPTRAATGSWLHFQDDGTGYSGFGAACAIDSRRGEVVLFGMWNYPACLGQHCSGYTNYDVTAFARFNPAPSFVTPVTLAGSPPARSDACAAYDSLSDQVWLFGGRFAVDSLCSESGCPKRPPLADLWRLDLSLDPPQWHEVLVSGARPAGRHDATMVVDAVAHRLLLFGGHDSSGTAFGDVWSLPLDGPSAWTRLDPVGVGPSARWSATALLDPSRRRILLVGGSDASGSVNDVWALDLSGPLAWSTLNVAGTAPTGVIHAILDVRRDLILAYSWPLQVTTLGLSGTPTWTPFTATNAPVRSRPGAFSYDPVHDLIWLPYEWADLPPGPGAGAEHWFLTLAQPPALPALDPVLDSVRYARGFEKEWWRLRPQRTGYRSVGVQIGDGLGAWGGTSSTQPAPDTTQGGVVTGPFGRSPGVTYASRMTWTEGPFFQTGGSNLLHAPLGPAAMRFTFASATFDTSGAVHINWQAANDSLSLLTPCFVERQDPGGWVVVLNDWPDTLQKIVLSETLPSGVTAVDYRVRWDGPRGVTYGGEVHLVRATSPPSPEPGSMFLGTPRPNPVIASAVLDYRLFAAGSATIRLFDLHGRSVREWAVAAPSAQSYPLDLRGVGSGLYLLRLQQGGRKVSVRMVIVR